MEMSTKQHQTLGSAVRCNLSARYSSADTCISLYMITASLKSELKPFCGIQPIAVVFFAISLKITALPWFQNDVIKINTEK